MTSDVQDTKTTSITTLSDTEVQITREFDAPRELVWEAYTDPELVPEWLGPRDLTVVIEEWDLRPGGSYRYTARDTEFVFFGEFREVDAPKVLVQTFAFEGMDAEPSIDRSEFVELEGGRTRIVVTSTLASKEDRDAMLASGMEKGVTEGYEMLDELLVRLKNKG